MSFKSYQMMQLYRTSPKRTEHIYTPALKRLGFIVLSLSVRPSVHQTFRQSFHPSHEYLSSYLSQELQYKEHILILTLMVNCNLDINFLKHLFRVLWGFFLVRSPDHGRAEWHPKLKLNSVVFQSNSALIKDWEKIVSD